MKKLFLLLIILAITTSTAYAKTRIVLVDDDGNAIDSNNPISVQGV